MSGLKTTLKKKCPGLLDLYRHYGRKKIIRMVNKRKKMSLEQIRFEIAKQYKSRIGSDLDWDNLNTYTEKMQWGKIYDKNPLRTTYADKYAVRQWVSETIGDEYLIPMLGVWDSFDEIDFDTLPERFVLKTNHGSGTNIIVKDKAKLNKKFAKRAFKDWLDTDFGYKSFELHYCDIKRKIIAEQYIESPYGELQDYKFLCFGGKPYFCWVDMGRYTDHTRNVYDLNWELQPWNQEHYAHYKEPIPKPENFDKMVEIATKLCQGFSHVRVDLYNVSGKIYFGEMTFTNGGGFDRILPTSYNRVLGDMWEIPEMKK